MFRCRTCGKSIYCLNAKNIFQKTENVILQNIKAVSGLLLEDDTELPGHICGPCEVSLREAIMFRDRIIRTQKLFSDIGNVSKAFMKIDLEDIERLSFPSDTKCESKKKVRNVIVKIKKEKSIQINPPNNSEMKPPKLQRRLGFPTPKFMPSLHFENISIKKKQFNWKDMPEDEKLMLKRALRKRQCICDQCGKSFTCPSNYKVHLLQHTGIKNFKCKECPMKFYTLQLLNRHKSTHLTEKPHACQYCKKTYSTSSIRNYHERRHHTNPKSFKCSDCDKVFFELLELKRHMIVHSDVRTFSCGVCDLRFKTRNNLVSHCRTKTHKNNADIMRELDPIEIQDVKIIPSNSTNESTPNDN